MSARYPGGFITKTPTAPTSSAAPGVWTLDQAMQNQKAGNWPSGFAPYIEDVFSTFLYTGTGASLPIVNGINLAANGGLTWTKARDSTAYHKWYDSARGIANAIESNTTDANQNEPTGITSFNSNGYTYGTDGNTNSSGTTYVSWTFAKRQKFFDIVTYTGNSTASRQISHNLGSTPGCIIIKSTTGGSAGYPWIVWHTSLSANTYLQLNTTDAAQSSSAYVSAVSSTTFTINSSQAANLTGDSYVAYIFAHNAGGFGLTGSDNVISCGSYTGNGSSTGPVITLGYEPQWVLIKNASSAQNWYLLDNMRGMPVGSADANLIPNLSNAESNSTVLSPTATGFQLDTTGSPNQNGETFIYIAIRRGPMKVPTVGTTVLNAITRSGNSTATTVTGVGFAPDLVFEAARTNSGGNNWVWFDRLRGNAVGLSSDNTGAEFTNSAVIQSDSLSTTMDGFRIQTANPINASGNTYVYYPLKRAPGFFDVVCYTGTSVSQTINHNLGVAPELMIIKSRNTATTDWDVLSNFTASNFKDTLLNMANSGTNQTYGPGGSPNFEMMTAQPSSSAFFVSASAQLNYSARTFVAYLFATCPGVSKVGSYTGTAALLTVNCSFTSGARFVLIKRTDSTGDWYVYDSARGISSSTDPYLFLNSTAAEVTGTNYVDTDTTGFKVTAAAPAGLNANGGTYIFLAIA